MCLHEREECEAADTYAGICRRMLTDADGCGRLLTGPPKKSLLEEIQEQEEREAAAAAAARAAGGGGMAQGPSRWVRGHAYVTAYSICGSCICCMLTYVSTLCTCLPCMWGGIHI